MNKNLSFPNSDTDTASEINRSGQKAQSFYSETQSASESAFPEDRAPSQCEDNFSTFTAHSADQDASDLIPHVEIPLNVFKNQIIFGNRFDMYEEPHSGYMRHFVGVEDLSKERMIAILKEKLKPNILNGIKIPERFLGLLQEVYLEFFSQFKIRIT